MDRPRPFGVVPKLLLTLLATLPFTVRGEAPPEVHEFRLDNGLKLLVKEDHRAPVVVSQIWYRVGSTYEPAGLTGISHVLEHMMFKGTEKVPAGQFSRIIAQKGGSENAFTGQDYTAYFQSLERSQLEVSLELEADRMRNLTIDPAEFAKEIEVVKEERRLRTEDDPQALTYERFNATAFLTSPARTPVIGWMWDLEGMSAEAVRSWYRQWYAPNNATVVVVGDVDPQQVQRLVQKHFGSLKASELSPRREPPELEQLGERRLSVRAPAKVPYLIMGYKAPTLQDAELSWEPYALEVLSGILSGGDSARLARDLVRGTQVAADASAGYDLHARSDGMFLLSAVPASGRSVEELERALREAIGKLQQQPIADRELARVKAQVIAGNVYKLDSNFYQAMEIGVLETLGLGWQTKDEYVTGVRAVTPEQVQAVAKKYLVDDRLTVAQLDPLPLDPGSGAHRGADAAGGRNDVVVQ